MDITYITVSLIYFLIIGLNWSTDGAHNRTMRWFLLGMFVFGVITLIAVVLSSVDPHVAGTSMRWW